MAKKSLIERNKKRERMTKKYAAKRLKLKQALKNPETSREERFQIVLKMAKIPRNASPVRVHNRCQITGRSRGYYRQFKISRIALRDMASEGHIPGMIKSSW